MKGAVGAAILRRCDVDPEDPDTLIVIDGGMAFRNSDAAIAICEKAGLRLEGILRSHRIDGRTGERLDQRIYGLLRSEYDKAAPAFAAKTAG